MHKLTRILGLFTLLLTLPCLAAPDPFALPPLHGAPRGPTSAPSPNPPAGKPNEAFLRQLIQNKWEHNDGGQTTLMNIHSFKVGSPRNPQPDEIQPTASGHKVLPVLVQWTSNGYQQFSDTSQEFERMWICWPDELGVWRAGTSGAGRTGDIKSTRHDSIP